MAVRPPGPIRGFFEPYRARISTFWVPVAGDIEPDGRFVPCVPAIRSPKPSHCFPRRDRSGFILAAHRSLVPAGQFCGCFSQRAAALRQLPLYGKCYSSRRQCRRAGRRGIGRRDGLRPQGAERRAFGPTREADRVLDFGANWYGAEAYYVRVQAALSNLKVKVVVALNSFGGAGFRMNWQNTGGCIPEPPYRRRCRCESGRRFTPQRCWVRRGDSGPICMEFRI